MTVTKPTIFFIHGAWHTPVHFGPVREVFERAGYETVCPRGASVGKSPPFGLVEDVQNVRDELKRLVNREEKDVLVVAHSYGGIVITEAADVTFSKAERAAAGLAGGIVRIVYMTASILPLGQSVASFFGEEDPPWMKLDETTQTYSAQDPTIFYSDLMPSEQERWAAYLLPMPYGAQFVKITQTAYTIHPVTYLYCTEDRAVPYELQQMMVENANSAGAKFETVSCNSGHSPFLSMPEKVLEIVSTLRVA